MGIIVWVFLGLATGLLASSLILGTRTQSLNPSDWLAATAGAACLLLAYRTFTRRSRRPGSAQ